MQGGGYCITTRVASNSPCSFLVATRESIMGYMNAGGLLPHALLRAVQRYVDGAYMYVPRREETKRQWGANTGIAKALLARNREIVEKRLAGRTVPELASEYFLSDKTIYKIIASAKRA